MKRVKILILVFILLISGAVLVSLWLNLRERKISERGSAMPEIAQEDTKMRLEKIHLVEDKQGRRTWELRATSVQQFEEKNIMTLDAVKVTYYAEDGNSFVLSGNKGKFYQDSKNIELIGDVILKSSDGYHLKTNSLSYDHSQKKATSSDPVEIEGDQFHFKGQGMMVDMEAKIFKILSQVKTQWKGGGKG
jgi:LPS export ABC transporter protein LptC